MKFFNHTHLINCLALGGVGALLYDFISENYKYCSDSTESITAYTLSALVTAGVSYTIMTSYHSKENLQLHIFNLLKFLLFIIFMNLGYGLVFEQDLNAHYKIFLSGHNAIELSNKELFYYFNSFSSGYQKFVGSTLLVAAFALLWRRTSLVASSVLALYSFNQLAYSLSFDLCNVAHQMITVGTCSLLSMQSIAMYLEHIKGNESSWMRPMSHKEKVIAMLIIFFTSGSLVHRYGQPTRIKHYAHANLENPFKGMWHIENLEIKSYRNPDAQDELKELQSLILDQSRYGVTRDKDSVSYFEFMVDSSHNQIEFWNFFDYRSLDLKGRYKNIARDTLLFEGVNAQDSIKFRMVFQPIVDKDKQ